MKRRTEFFYTICNNRRKLWILALICLIGILLSLPAIFTVEPGTATYYIAIFDVIGLTFLIVTVGLIIYGCRRKFGE